MHHDAFLYGLTPLQRRLMRIADSLSEHHNKFIPAKEILKVYFLEDLKREERLFEAACEKLEEHVDPIEFYPSESVGFVYRTLLAMGQTWKIRYPFFDLHGTVGDLHDDEPSGPDLVEIRISMFSHIIFPTDEAPLLPVSLLNGFTLPDGWLVPSHQIDELWMAFEEVRQNPGVAVEDLMEIIPGPDFASGGITAGSDSILSLYKGGKETLILQGQIEVIIEGPRTRVLIHSIPPGALLKPILEKIKGLSKTGLIVHELKDQTEGNRIRIFLDVPGKWTPEILKDLLFKETGLEKRVPFACGAPEGGAGWNLPGLVAGLKFAAERCAPAWEFKGEKPPGATAPFLRDILKYGGWKSPLYELSDERRTRLRI